jgi:hypothetical protein
MNYGSQRVLAEPLGTQTQDVVAIVDARVARIVTLSGRSKLSAQLDFYNLLNANPEDCIAWGSGSSDLRPSSVIPPRIVRFGLKVDW